MTRGNKTTADRQPPRRQVKPGRVVVFAVVFGLGLLTLAGYYRAHLIWCYKARDAELNDVRAIPDLPMPESPTPDDWVRCRVGRLEFSLPPELGGDGNPVETCRSWAAFQNESRKAVVGIPSDPSEFSDWIETASKVSPSSERFTMPRLRHACYQADSDDFRWSMTPKEVGWHAFRIALAEFIRTLQGGHTESLFRDDMDILLHVGDRCAVVWWEASDPKLGGYIHLSNRGNDEFDPAWGRAVSRSLRVVGVEK